MIMTRKYTLILLILICGAVVFSSCKRKVEPTTVQVIDPNRHYYPILQGQEMDMKYEIVNVGNNPLFITEIQPSCGCMVVDDDYPITVLPHKNGFIHIKYNSTKNVGLVDHYIRCYGNFAKTGMLELRFDVHVVPDADYTRDYEELYRDYEAKNGKVKEAVDGKESNQYYVGQP
jgi:hypothetical protein